VKDHLCEKIDRFIEKEVVKREEQYIKKTGGKKRSTFSPSFISRVDCLRAWVYHYTNEKPDSGLVDTQLQRIFAVGHDVHDRVQGLLQRMGILTRENTEIRIYDEEYKIKGFVDGVLDVKKGGEDHNLVLEIKSANEGTFERVVNTGKAKLDHIKQAMIYLWQLDLDEAIIYYECKNDQRHKSVRISADAGTIERIKKKIKRVFYYAERGELPDVCYNGRVKECTWCDWKLKCQGHGGTKRRALMKA
jgi:hypothetical protein